MAKVKRCAHCRGLRPGRRVKLHASIPHIWFHQSCLSELMKLEKPS